MAVCPRSILLTRFSRNDGAPSLGQIPELWRAQLGTRTSALTQLQVKQDEYDRMLQAEKM